MKISVAICTWNRADLLRMTLRSFSQLDSNASGDWELVVVDNNSTDSTPFVCKEFSSSLPIRIVSERQQGHSFSRNCAVANSTGDFILWTDDDVLVPANWIASYRAAMALFPDVDFFGGPIEPILLAAVPRWIQQNRETCDGVFARRQLGDQPIELGKHNLPFGANFATRRLIQEKYPFRGEFGRVGTGIRGYDEIDVLSRMVNDGYAGRWVPAAPVQHLIPKSRMTTQYIYDYFFGQGQTWVKRGLATYSVSDIEKHIRYHVRSYWLTRFRRDTRQWFSHLVQLGNLRGQRDQLRQPDN